MAVRFEIDYSQFEELEKRMKQIPQKTESVLNSYLHNEAIRIATKEITDEMPVSSMRGAIRPKNHAKYSDWSKSEQINLGFTIKSKGGAARNKNSFGYLVFPNEGRGSSNPREQRFMEKGMENATSIIMDELIKRLDEVIKKTL